MTTEISSARKRYDFGSVIVFGLGGIGTEITKSIGSVSRLSIKPWRDDLLKIQDLKLLQGYRGKKPAT
jgi:hypothetical protein